MRSSTTLARFHALGATVLLWGRGSWGRQSMERPQGPAWPNRKAETSCKEPANQPIGHPAPSQGHGATAPEASNTMATRNATSAFMPSKKTATLLKCATIDSVLKNQPARQPKALADPEQATKIAFESRLTKEHAQCKRLKELHAEPNLERICHFPDETLQMQACTAAGQARNQTTDRHI